MTEEEVFLLSRRKFFSRLSVGLGVLCAGLVGVPVVGALLGPLLEKPRHRWRDVGPLDTFEPGTTTLVVFENANAEPWAGMTAHTAAWLRRDAGNDFLLAFAVNCTHLGCPVRWESNAQLFMCPCHGGVFNKDGSVAAGPPQRPLQQYQVRVNNNRVEILTAPIPITTINNK